MALGMPSSNYGTMNHARTLAPGAFSSTCWGNVDTARPPSCSEVYKFWAKKAGGIQPYLLQPKALRLTCCPPPKSKKWGKLGHL